MSTELVHPTAVIDPTAQIGSDVEIGPYAVIEGPVKIGSGTHIGPHAYLVAPLEIGSDCQIHVGAVVGHLHQALREPQDGGVQVGDRTIIREYATIHRSSKVGTNTTIGSDCMIMGFAHVAHDCIIRDHVIVSNGTLLAGHITAEERAIISGHVTVHQFVRIGSLSMIGGLSRVTKDVPPYFLVKGDSEVWSVNVVGLQRAGFSQEARTKVREAFRLLYRAGLNTTQALEEIQKSGGDLPEIKHLVQFIQESPRGICRYRRGDEAVLDEEEGDVV